MGDGMTVDTIESLDADQRHALVCIAEKWSRTLTEEKRIAAEYVAIVISGRTMGRPNEAMMAIVSNAQYAKTYNYANMRKAPTTNGLRASPRTAQSWQDALAKVKSPRAEGLIRTVVVSSESISVLDLSPTMRVLRTEGDA